MLPTIDLKAPPLDDLQIDEPSQAAEPELMLLRHASNLDTHSLFHARPVPSFRNVVLRPIEPPPTRPEIRIATDAERGAVLVADDFEANRRTVARTLKMQGLSVTPAENGRQALELLRERAFDLVLLDIVMPEMDGYQVLEQIRADPSLQHIPVVIISGVEDMASIVRCIELGAADYLFKPFDPVLLKARVRACLETKRLRDQEQALLRQVQAEQARSESLLLNILPEPIVEQLKHGRQPIAELFDDVTVLFADLVDFTGLAGRLEPTELVSMLDEIFSIFDGLAEQYGLEKIKTIGDAYMAVGGLPRPSLNHADAVANMALAMQAAIAEYGAARIRSARGPERYQLRIGISTGPAVAGVIGRKKYIYDLWGNTVNIASRMESLGQAGRIHVSAATYERLRKRYHFGERGVVYVKGKGEMETYFLTGKR
jgi:class 3 adenylate cyclase